MEKFKLVWSVKSECGPIRKKNEDSVFPDLSGSGFVPFKAGVFDGMGGHKKGEVASELASTVMKKEYENLISYVEEANKAIYEYQENNTDSEGMGTTMTAIEIDEDGVLHVAHVGDSRCYVLSKRKLIKLTEDENVPGYQNVLLQALGTKKKLSIQTKDIRLFKGDVVLLCTDGLYNELGEEFRIMDAKYADQDNSFMLTYTQGEYEYLAIKSGDVDVLIGSNSNIDASTISGIELVDNGSILIANGESNAHLITDSGLFNFDVNFGSDDFSLTEIEQSGDNLGRFLLITKEDDNLQGIRGFNNSGITSSSTPNDENVRWDSVFHLSEGKWLATGIYNTPVTAQHSVLNLLLFMTSWILQRLYITNNIIKIIIIIPDKVFNC